MIILSIAVPCGVGWDPLAGGDPFDAGEIQGEGRAEIRLFPDERLKPGALSLPQLEEYPPAGGQKRGGLPKNATVKGGPFFRGEQGDGGLEAVGLLAVFEQRRGQLRAERADTQEALAVAENVESAQVLTEARGTKVSARSSRSSIIVGALIGLIAGVLLALLWDPLTSRLRRADT